MPSFLCLFKIERHLEQKKVGIVSYQFCVLSTPAGARTLDTLIKSQVLYQLSYGCIIFCCFIQYSF